ncbi:MAG: hypothetical protein Q4C95_08880 [Planctomycetia bacterium]|nr:hypothetical protein [Planctomycetia bacterium]
MKNNNQTKKEKIFLFPIGRMFIVAVIIFGTIVGCTPSKKQYQINEALLIDQTRVLENEVYRTRFLLKKCLEENERLRQELGGSNEPTESRQNVPIKRNSSLDVSVSPSYRMQTEIMTQNSMNHLPNRPVLPNSLQNNQVDDPQSSGFGEKNVVPGSQFVPDATPQLPLSQNQKRMRTNRKQMPDNQSGQLNSVALLPERSTHSNNIPGVIQPIQTQTPQNNSAIWQLDPSITTSQNPQTKTPSNNSDNWPQQTKTSISVLNNDNNPSSIQNPVYQQPIDQNSDSIRPMNYDSSFSHSEEIPWSPIQQ